MRILMLTQWFDPEPTVKGLPFARALVRAGHDVHVITGFPNYPGGNVYPGYKLGIYRREMIDGIPVTRVALYPSHSRSAVGRIANYATFAVSATVAGLLSRFKPDVMYVYHPPLTVGVAAAVIAAVRRVPFVYDVQDLWPESLEATGMVRSKLLLRLVGVIARRVYARATVVVAQSPGFVRRLVDQGVPPEKMRLIYNWCDEEALASRSAKCPIDQDQLRDRFNVVFAGNLGKAQALQSVLDAAALVKAHHPKVQFIMIGHGTEAAALKEDARLRGLDNVLFLPRVDMREVGHVLDSADALLVHLRDSPLFTITLPSKVQAYLYAAKPIIMAVSGDAADVVSLAEAGVCVNPEDPEGLAEAILHLRALSDSERQAMGARGRQFYERSMSLAVGSRLMIEAFESAVAPRLR